MRRLAAAYLPPPPAAYRPRPQRVDARAPARTLLFPPPNVTGKLHLGHALTVTIQDAWARFQRMRGTEVHWIHGLDHAGIATQAVVERHLAKTLGQQPRTRQELERHAWEWTLKHKSLINDQLKMLGASLSFDQGAYFTLDEERRAAVVEAFCRLSEAKLVHRALRMVNWCPHLGTAISDLEVDHVRLDQPAMVRLPSGESIEFGIADEFAYPVERPPENGPKELPVRTTRLETMLGDVAVVVHPHDARYKALHGRFCVHPLTRARLPILCDEVLANPSVGTGAVKLTPAHDADDYKASLRLGVPVGQRVFGDDGKMLPIGGAFFQGMSRFQCRLQLRLKLTELGLYRGKRSNPMSLGVCSRSGDVVEPMLKPQWYISTSSLAEIARACPIEFHPSEARADWQRWLSDSQDWCVSRQLWWGHRIPAWRVKGTGEARWVIARSEADAVAKLGSSDVEQDEDVLDTWFSSGLLPLSANGWPDGVGSDYPLALMETGSDILFFWVARMVMLCCFLHGTPPFPKVYLHSLVRDKHNRKMSKSLGNVIDPAHVISGVTLDALLAELRSGNLDKRELARAEADVRKDLPNGIPALGADALRLALAFYPSTAPLLFDVDRVVQARQLCNKMWQACRFAISKDSSTVDGGGVVAQGQQSPTKSLEDRWIMSRLARATAECAAGYENLDLHIASSAARRFFVTELCDVYIEACKTGDAKALLPSVQGGLALFYPLAPVVTETLGDAVGELKWPSEHQLQTLLDPEAESQVDCALQVVRAIRLLQTKMQGLGTAVYIVDCPALSDPALALAQRLSRVASLSRDSSSFITVSQNRQGGGGLIELLAGSAIGRVRAEIPELASDEVVNAHLVRLETKLYDQREAKERLEKKLESKEFSEKAPASIKQREKERLQSLEQAVEVAKAAVDALKILIK